MEARTLIEVKLAGLGAQRATTADLEEIGAKLDEMERALTDVDQFQRADITFHLTGRTRHPNSILMNTLLRILNISSRIGSAECYGLKAWRQRHWRNISKSLFAIVKKNQLAARSAVLDHLREMASFLLTVPEAPQDDGAISQAQNETASSK